MGLAERVDSVYIVNIVNVIQDGWSREGFYIAFPLSDLLSIPFFALCAAMQLVLVQTHLAK
jgi:hypothetical protein